MPAHPLEIFRLVLGVPRGRSRVNYLTNPTMLAKSPIHEYIRPMDRTTALSRLKRHEAELRGMGVASLSVFGSTARGEAGPSSDVDLAATFADDSRLTAFDFVGVMQRIEQILGLPVDLVSEPARKMRLQTEIDRDRVRVF